MDKIPVFVGIDVAKHRLEVHLRPPARASRSIYSEEEGWRRWSSAACSPLSATLIVLEATGGLESASPRSWPRLPCRRVVNPRQARSFARAMGRRAKTDVWMPR